MCCTSAVGLVSVRGLRLPTVHRARRCAYHRDKYGGHRCSPYLCLLWRRDPSLWPEMQSISSGSDQSASHSRAPFATFFAHNDPAVLLLSLLKASTSRQGLTSSNNGIGYRLELPHIRNPDHVWPGFKWVIGAGMSPKKHHTKVDLLLCPPQTGPARIAV